MMTIARRCLVLALLGTVCVSAPGSAQDEGVPGEHPFEINQQALTKWFSGDYPGALQELARAIELDPDWDVLYNHRALVWAALENPLAGLADANRAVELAEAAGVSADNRAANLDTRAYVYLKLGQYENALADYERALGNFVDPQPESLLGRGLTFAALGEDRRAFMDFEAGLRFAALSRPNPQLIDLVIETQETLPDLRVPTLPDEFEPDNSPAQAKPLTLDGWLQVHSLHAPGDVDWVSFSLVAGQRLHIFTSSPTCDTVLTIFGPDGRAPLAEDDNSGIFRDSVLDFSVATTGTHYARIRHADPAGTCVSYDLGATVSPAIRAPATPL
jgi:hypothetical protein